MDILFALVVLVTEFDLVDRHQHMTMIVTMFGQNSSGAELNAVELHGISLE